MTELWFIGITGAAVGGVLGWPMIRYASLTSVRLLGYLLCFGGVAAALIAAQHGAIVPRSWLPAVEHLLAAGNLAFWAGVVLWVRTCIGDETSRLASVLLFALPLSLYGAYALTTGDVPRFVWLLPAGTTASAYIYVLWARRRHEPGDALHGALLSRMIALAVAMNLAQAIRSFFPHVELLREIVPITLTGGFLSIAELSVRRIFSASADRGAAQEASPETSPRYAKSALDSASAQQLLSAIDCGMREHGWYREVGLSLAELAKRLDTRPHLVSQALNQVRKTTLADYLAMWRVAEARRRLVDPAFDRLTIDALAEEAGFASRSAFYKAFKTREGMTPTEYRARQRSAEPTQRT